MGISIVETIIACIIPFSQLYFRVVTLEGSLEHAWTLIPIFFFPPFSIVPALLMYFGQIGKGKGGKPYDSFMYIPIIFNIIVSLVASCTDGILCTLLLSLIPVIGSMTAYYSRFQLICKEKANSTEGVDFTKVLTDGMITQAMASIAFFVMGFLPIIGTLFSAADMIPVVPEIMTGVLYMIAYMIMNMINGYDINNYCSTKASIGRWVFFALSFVGYFGIKVANQFL